MFTKVPTALGIMNTMRRLMRTIFQSVMLICFKKYQYEENIKCLLGKSDYSTLELTSVIFSRILPLCFLVALAAI